ncbi:Sphingomyelin phosphodiesterase [Termitomyces sp. J132]|nr:Sphingomyelin phosphodiesterase [Termitomyces sp. J132]
MHWAVQASLAAALQSTQLAAASLIVPQNFTVPGVFPTSVFSEYYNSPTATSAQVQPVISDPVTHKVYPFSLTNPDTIPLENKVDPHILPPVASSSKIYNNALQQIGSIHNNPAFSGNNCARCVAILEVLKFVALAAPERGPDLFVDICNTLKLSSTCEATFGLLGIGSVITQVVANFDAGGFDGQAFCFHFLGGLCPSPGTTPLDLNNWFKKPKPNPPPKAKKRSGKRLKVLHMSDFHIDPRYATSSEANCTGSPCCRKNVFNTASPNITLLPAPRYGAFHCDTPMALGMAALQAIPALTGTQDNGFAWTIYTGDLVSHDPDKQLSRDYVKYVETILYDLFKRMLGTGPVYAALGNHDSYNQAQDAPASLGGALAQQFSWNYDHVADLWKHEKWLPAAAVQLAKRHYAGYMVKRMDGLRVIALNTDILYSSNYFNYINMTNPDVSGMLRFLTDELQSAEDAGDRVWIIGHVLSGWDGTNPLENPTNLLDRYSPHVIASMFTSSHQALMKTRCLCVFSGLLRTLDRCPLQIFYANNATVMSAETAQALAWIGPSVTPITNLNSGFRVYEVDSATFEIMEAHTWKSDVSSFPDLDDQTAFGPVYTYEYNTRQTYGKTITSWTPNDPLNATWWHLVTEAMEADPSLVMTFNTFQGKSSVQTKPCTDECVAAKICLIRSGSATFGLSCPPGFGSVQ